MKKILFTVFSLCLAATLPAQAPQNNDYQFFTDLTNCSDDRLHITLIPPKQKSNDLRFCFPATVPGLYRPMHFGQYVHDLQAFDAKNKALPVTRENQNVWRIENGKRLARLSYVVDDSWDSLNVAKADFIHGAGAAFVPGEGFLINNNALFGFFEGQRERPFQLHFKKPTGFHGATALENTLRNDSMEQFSAPNYRELADGPLLFSLPDTASFQVDSTEIRVAVFNDMPGANYPYATILKEAIVPQWEALYAYLGDTLPLQHYTLLVYFQRFDGDLVSGGFEHNRSALYLYAGRGMGRVAEETVENSMRAFLRVVAPLNLPSDKTLAYNFLQPDETQHRWLYEGYTEYASMQLSVCQRMILMDSFMQLISERCKELKNYDAGIPLTELSKEFHSRPGQYDNFYVRGVLANLCLDLRLCELSRGKYNLGHLITGLRAKYGPAKPLSDAALFDEIAAMTYPEIRDFFRRYVEGTEPLPLAECLIKCGLVFDATDYSVQLTGTPTQEQWTLRKGWIGR